MKIKVKNNGYGSLDYYTYDIMNYMRSRLSSKISDPFGRRDGELACEETKNISMAFGRLCEVLIKKGIIDVTDIQYIANEKETDISLVDE